MQMARHFDKLPEVMDQARKASTPVEAWHYLITDETFDNLFQ